MSFINLTNHPSTKWDETQISAAEAYGEIIDMPFPAIDAEADEDDVKKLATEYIQKIMDENPKAVLCQGEFTFVYNIVNMLKERGIPVLSACSKRESVEEIQPDGSVQKSATFKFVRFREYR